MPCPIEDMKKTKVHVKYNLIYLKSSQVYGYFSLVCTDRDLQFLILDHLNALAPILVQND